MTDLTGAELDAAVARVMGLRAEMDEGSVWLLPPTDLSTSSYDWGTPGNRVCAREFRPSQGGAAAWEVLEYARNRWGWFAVADAIEEEIAADEAESSLGTYACRAVVALGDC